MNLRTLLESKTNKIVAVMPGGFHPFHPGHKSLYDWAVKTFGQENVYVAATDNIKERPFPFDVKKKLAAMAGVPAERFIQVKSPFNALSYSDILSDPSTSSLIFIRSDKDKTSHPLPDQIRKSDGMMGYLVSYRDNEELETADTHGYMAYGPTIDFNFSGMSIKSASELRAAWPEMSDEDKLKAAELMYPGNGRTATELLNKALGVKEPDMAEDVSPEEEDKFHNELDDLVHKYFGDSPDEEKMKKKYRKTVEKAPPGREDQVKALKKEFPDDEGAPYAIAWAQHNKKKKKTNESDVVIDPTQLRQYLRMLIDDAIDKEQDIEKLSKVLKLLVGKEIKSRGNRYKITSEDISEAINMKIREITENSNNIFSKIKQKMVDNGIDPKRAEELIMADYAKKSQEMSRSELRQYYEKLGLIPDEKTRMSQRSWLGSGPDYSDDPLNDLFKGGYQKKDKSKDIKVDIFTKDDPRFKESKTNERSEELPDGSTKDFAADGSYTHSGAWGKKFYDASGKLIKTRTPVVDGLHITTFADGRKRYMYGFSGGEVRGPMTGDKPGEADFLRTSFGGTNFIFDARRSQPVIKGSITIGRMKVEFTGKVLDRPAFHKDPFKMASEILGGDIQAAMRDPRAAKPMIKKGTAKVFLDGKEIPASQIDQAVEQGL